MFRTGILHQASLEKVVNDITLTHKDFYIINTAIFYVLSRCQMGITGRNMMKVATLRDLIPFTHVQYLHHPYYHYVRIRWVLGEDWTEEKAKKLLH